jgi:hypothetical protein
VVPSGTPTSGFARSQTGNPSLGAWSSGLRSSAFDRLDVIPAARRPPPGVGWSPCRLPRGLHKAAMGIVAPSTDSRVDSSAREDAEGGKVHTHPFRMGGQRGGHVAATATTPACRRQRDGHRLWPRPFGSGSGANMSEMTRYRLHPPANPLGSAAWIRRAPHVVAVVTRWLRRSPAGRGRYGPSLT